MPTVLNAQSFGGGLQEAINAASDGAIINVGSQSVSSTITINKTLTLRNGTLTLSGGSLKAAADNVTLDNVDFIGDAAHVLALADANYSGWLFTNCNFAGVTLRLTKRGRTLTDGSTESTGTGVTDGSVIDRCTFTNYEQNYTIEIGGCNGVVVRNCHIHDTGLDTSAGDGIKVLAGSFNTLIEDCIIERTTRDAIDLYDSNHNTIRGCTLRECNLGIDTKLGSANDSSTQLIDDCLIEDNGAGVNGNSNYTTTQNCIVRNNDTFGVRVARVGDVVQNNTVTGNGDNIRIAETASDYSIEGNTTD